MKHRCDTCVYFQILTEDALEGKCRFEPPQFIMDGTSLDIDWPDVNVDHWCGKHPGLVRELSADMYRELYNALDDAID
jgi:hypothetical protein